MELALAVAHSSSVVAPSVVVVVAERDSVQRSLLMDLDSVQILKIGCDSMKS